MNAYEFIAKLLMEINYVNTTFAMMENKKAHWNDGDFQWINTKYCHIKPGKVILGLSIVDDDPEENYIDTIYKLRDFFLKNNVSKNDKIYIAPTEGALPLKDFTVGKANGTTVIICDYDMNKLTSWQDV